MYTSKYLCVKVFVLFVISTLKMKLISYSHVMCSFDFVAVVQPENLIDISSASAGVVLKIRYIRSFERRKPLQVGKLSFHLPSTHAICLGPFR